MTIGPLGRARAAPLARPRPARCASPSRRGSWSSRQRSGWVITGGGTSAPFLVFWSPLQEAQRVAENTGFSIADLARELRWKPAYAREMVGMPDTRPALSLARDVGTS